MSDLNNKGGKIVPFKVSKDATNKSSSQDTSTAGEAEGKVEEELSKSSNTTGFYRRCLRLLGLSIGLLLVPLCICFSYIERHADREVKAEAMARRAIESAKQAASLVANHINQISENSGSQIEFSGFSQDKWQETDVSELGLAQGTRLVTLSASYEFSHYVVNGSYPREDNTEAFYDYQFKLETLNPKTGKSHLLAQYNLDAGYDYDREHEKTFFYSNPSNEGVIYSNHREWFSQDFQKMSINRIYEIDNATDEERWDNNFPHFGWLTQDGEFHDVSTLLEFEDARPLTFRCGLGFVKVLEKNGNGSNFFDEVEVYIIRVSFLEDNGEDTDYLFPLPLKELEQAFDGDYKIKIKRNEMMKNAANYYSIPLSDIVAGDTIVSLSGSCIWDGFELALFDFDDLAFYAASSINDDEFWESARIDVPNHESDIFWNDIVNRDGFTAFMVANKEAKVKPEDPNEMRNTESSQDTESEAEEQPKNEADGSDSDNEGSEDTSSEPDYPTLVWVISPDLKYAVVEPELELSRPSTNLEFGKSYTVLLDWYNTDK